MGSTSNANAERLEDDPSDEAAGDLRQGAAPACTREESHACMHEIRHAVLHIQPMRNHHPKQRRVTESTTD